MCLLQVTLNEWHISCPIADRLESLSSQSGRRRRGIGGKKQGWSARASVRNRKWKRLLLSAWSTGTFFRNFGCLWRLRCFERWTAKEEKWWFVITEQGYVRNSNTCHLFFGSLSFWLKLNESEEDWPLTGSPECLAHI